MNFRLRDAAALGAIHDGMISRSVDMDQDFASGVPLTPRRIDDTKIVLVSTKFWLGEYSRGICEKTSQGFDEQNPLYSREAIPKAIADLRKQ